MSPTLESVRIHPESWLWPLPLEKHFPRPAPLEIDLGCGKGRFLLARAATHPDINFLGIDRMLRRLRKVDGKAARAGLDNVRLLRMEAYYATVYLIPPGRVRTFYIFFPDPWPKKRHHKHRLFNAPFMDALVKTLEPGGAMHLATDHGAYFEEIQELLRADRRFQLTDPFIPSDAERTDFERIFHGRAAIHRVSVVRR
jgi:tRNA (guanine-N7-)-methyltransferase